MFKLTDDDVVALSVRVGAPWGAPTPTVDLADQDELTAAARRGERSLYARGLLREDPVERLGALDDSASRLLEPALRRAVLCSVFLADSGLNWHPEGLNAVYYRGADPDTCLMETVSAAGVHDFAEVPRTAVLGAVADLVDAAWDGGVRLTAEGDTVETLCVATVQHDDVAVLQVGKNSARLRENAAAGTGDSRAVDRQEAESWLRAIA